MRNPIRNTMIMENARGIPLLSKLLTSVIKVVVEELVKGLKSYRIV